MNMNNLCPLLIYFTSSLHLTIQVHQPKVVLANDGGVVREGEYFELQCLNEGIKEAVDWYKNGKKYLSDHYDISGIADSETGGSYRCELRSWRRFRRSEPLTVVTIVRNLSVVVTLPKDGVVKRGKHFALECQQEGLKMWASWYKDGERIRDYSYWLSGTAGYRTGGSYQCGLPSFSEYRKSKPLDLFVIVWDFTVLVRIPSDGVVREGEYFQLKCLENGEYDPINWYKDDKAIQSNAYDLSGTADHLTGGSYECGKWWWKSKSLDVIVVASDILTLDMKPQHPLLGDNIVLECLKPSGTFGEYPVQWYRNNSPIPETSGSRISVETANRSNEASYRCELRSRYRKWVSEDINIALIDLCSTPILKVHPELEVFAGQQLNFTCSAEQLQIHYPLLYSFYKNEQLISVPAEQDYYVTEPVVLEDSASYRCEVTTYNSTRKKSSNKLSITVTLIPVSKPDLEIQPRSEIIVGETPSLICSVSTGSTPINYVFYSNLIKVIHWETSNNTRITYQIVDVGKSAEGNYSCSVSNQASEISLYSESIPLAVIVPVAGALLTSNSNKTEISIGDPLVLHCQLKEGTFPNFLWYLNHQQLENISDYYNFSTDGGQLNIHSFQIRDKGRYHCAVINRGPNEVSFNTTSNYVDITAPAQSQTAAISASVSTIILISAVIVWLCSKQRKRKQDSPSSISQQQGDTSRNGPQNTSEVSPEINFEYAVVGRCQNIDSSNGQSNNCTVHNISYAEDDSETTAGLVYSVVTITKSKGSGNSGDTSAGKQGDKKTDNDYCITYATLNHRTNEDSLEGDQTEEGGFYENLPRHSANQRK